jgi:hypothetical protein
MEMGRSPGQVGLLSISILLTLAAIHRSVRQQGRVPMLHNINEKKQGQRARRFENGISAVLSTRADCWL